VSFLWGGEVFFFARFFSPAGRIFQGGFLGSLMGAYVFWGSPEFLSLWGGKNSLIRIFFWGGPWEKGAFSFFFLQKLFVINGACGGKKSARV